MTAFVGKYLTFGPSSSGLYFSLCTFFLLLAVSLEMAGFVNEGCN